MWWLLIGYIAISGVIAGVINGEYNTDDPGEAAGMCFASMLWPLVVVAFVVMLAMGIPFWLGKKLHQTWTRW